MQTIDVLTRIGCATLLMTVEITPMKGIAPMLKHPAKLMSFCAMMGCVSLNLGIL